MALCYKDRTFCRSDCVVTACFRYYDEEIAQEAKDFGLPVALSDFSKRCPDYVAGWSIPTKTLVALLAMRDRDEPNK